MINKRLILSFAVQSIVAVIPKIVIMEAEVKQIIKEKEYVHDENRKEYASKGVGNAALATGIIGTALGAAAIWGRGRGGFGFGGNMPENVNINTVSDAIAGRNGAAPTAFGAYSHSCEAQLALTNEMWGLKMNTLNLMYQHRDTDVAEKFGLWKSQVDGDFGLYKSMRDLYDVQADKLNNAAFGLYKSQRDGFDVLNARISGLEKEVAVGAAIRPYQDKLIMCEIDKAFTASINHTDRLDCRNIKGVVTLPSTPTVTGFPSQRCGYCPGRNPAPTA